MPHPVLETERLSLRRLTWDDRADLCEILQDTQAMYAYEHAFSGLEVDDWLARQLTRYERDGFGLWAAIRREDGAFVGQIGITLQDWGGAMTPEIGYLLKRRYWHMGYCVEGARGCMDYAFRVLKLDQVCSIIRDSNAPSRAVALKNGMRAVDRIVKYYYGMEMPHDVFLITRSEFQNQIQEVMTP